MSILCSFFAYEQTQLVICNYFCNLSHFRACYFSSILYITLPRCWNKKLIGKEVCNMLIALLLILNFSQSMNFYSPWKPTISWWFWGGNRSWLIHLNSLNIGRETWQQSLKEPYLWKLEWGKFCSNLHYSKQSRSLFTMKTNHDLYHIIILRARSCASLKFFPCNHQTFEYVIIRARDLSE